MRPFGFFSESPALVVYDVDEFLVSLLLKYKLFWLGSSSNCSVNDGEGEKGSQVLLVQDVTGSRTPLLGGASGEDWVTSLPSSPGLLLHTISKSTPISGSSLGTVFCQLPALRRDIFSCRVYSDLRNEQSGCTG